MKTGKIIAIALIIFALIVNIIAIVILTKSFSLENTGLKEKNLKLVSEESEKTSENGEVVKIKDKITQTNFEMDNVEPNYARGRRELPSWTYNNSTEPTNIWMNFYGEIKINNKPAEIGDKIAAFDLNNTLLGIFVIKENGKYGFFHVYGDDLTTSVHEGANVYDKIIFRFYDASEEKETPLKITNSASPVFTEYGMMNVDLDA